MSIHEDHRPLDRDAAELLLSGDPAARAAHPWLGAVLAAAGSPGAGAALPGEDAAVAAFAAAHTPSVRPRRISVLKTTLAKLLTVKVAGACLAVVGGAGGVALAASNGALPVLPHHDKAPHHAPASGSPSSHPHPSGTPSARPSHSFSPADFAKLCQKWDARPGHSQDDPDFGDLVKRAGRDHIDRFCTDLRKPHPSGSFSFPGLPHPQPSGSASPHGSGQPGPRPSSLPSGSTRPDGR
ncbi:hypothetical protein [Actinoplanes subtropicus]|uniref:hypothetical protein n=1 Tax=Actinoplanes subtropicus TaxID=543632 RepID=UPI0004C33E0B|nr:hypothetical protein [Actinoplanes subtropicus]